MVNEIARDEDVQGLNREELLQMAISTAKQNPQGARVMFMQVLSQDPRNERALLWMAYLSRKKSERRTYLLKVLKVNPDNTTAIKELQRMARTEKARSNRTLVYGAIAITAVVMLVVLAVLVVVAIT